MFRSHRTTSAGRTVRIQTLTGLSAGTSYATARRALRIQVSLFASVHAGPPSAAAAADTAAAGIGAGAGPGEALADAPARIMRITSVTRPPAMMLATATRFSRRVSDEGDPEDAPALSGGSADGESCAGSYGSPAKIGAIRILAASAIPPGIPQKAPSARAGGRNWLDGTAIRLTTLCAGHAASRMVFSAPGPRHDHHSASAPRQFSAR